MGSVGKSGSQRCRNVKMKNSMSKLCFHNAHHVFFSESVTPLLVREKLQPLKFKMLANIQIGFNFHCHNFQNYNSKFQSRLIVNVWQSTLWKHFALSKQDSDSLRLHLSTADLARVVTTKRTMLAFLCCHSRGWQPWKAVQAYFLALKTSNSEEGDGADLFLQSSVRNTLTCFTLASEVLQKW